MCIIVHQPRGTYLTKERASRLWKANSDGGGFAFINDNAVIQTGKSMMFPSFWSQFENARSEFPDRDFLIHMRIATHGATDIHNVHPFDVDDHTVMVHNGIFSMVPDYKDGRSDTAVFVDEVLRDLPKDWLNNFYLLDMMEDWVGYNKMAFLTTAPDVEENVVIINRSYGTVIDGMWFSSQTGVRKPFVQQLGGRVGGVLGGAINDGWKEQFDARPTNVVTGKGDTPLARSRTTEPSGSGSRTRASSTQDGTTTIERAGLTSGNRKYKWDNGVLVPMTTQESESSESFPNWLSAEDEETYKDVIADVEAIVTSVASDAAIEHMGHKRAKSEIMHDRHLEGNYMKIAFDPGAQKWTCMGCDEFLDFKTKDILNGDCACWEKLCLACSRFAVMCTCHTGWVSNPIWMSEAEGGAVAMAIDAYNSSVEFDIVPF